MKPTPEDREAARQAWREAHDAELAQRAASRQAEREAKREAWRAADTASRQRAADPDQLALDELVAKRLGIPVEDVPAWRASRQRFMAGLGTLDEQLAKAPVAGKDDA